MATAANAINESTTGICGFTGTSFTGTPVTQYNVLTGAATSSALNNIAPSATSGVPLISQGSSSQPIFGTAVVAGGGTGNTTFTAYSVICAGTTSTGAFQNVSGVGSSGQVLTSNGASALPTWQTVSSSGFTSVVTRVFTSSGTYTPTASMKYCIVCCVGGGGASPSCNGSSIVTTGGGGGGGYSQKTFAAATIGASKTVTIGAGGSGGGAGGTTSLSTLITATGGQPGGNSSSVDANPGGAGGGGTLGDFICQGAPGGASCNGTGQSFTTFSIGGNGGSSFFGGGAAGQAGTSGAIGVAGQSYGGGASGACQGTSAGASGFAGIIVIHEFV